MHIMRENIVPVKELLDIIEPKKGDIIIDAGSGSKDHFQEYGTNRQKLK